MTNLVRMNHDTRSASQKPASSGNGLTRRGEIVAGGLVAVAALALAATGIHIVHDRDAALEKLAHKNDKVTSVMTASKDIVVEKALVNDTVGSMVEKYSDVTTTSPGSIPIETAFANAVHLVEKMPQNQDALKDGILQIGEKITIPTAITASPELDNTNS